MILEPVTLEGSHVRLEPLSLEHHAALCEAGLDEELWRLNPQPVTNAEEMRAYIAEALAGHARGMFLPFATIEKSSGKAIGSTRFGNIELPNRRLEIGWTWIARPWQRTFVNTEAKYLMLRYAFEQLGCMRVEFKTDSLNERSRAAILRLGAKEEGIFRKHMTTNTGRIRHSVYFSIIDDEWPDVKKRLEAKLSPVSSPQP